MKGFRHINYRGRQWDIVEQPWDKDPGFPMSEVEYLRSGKDAENIAMAIAIEAIEKYSHPIFRIPSDTILLHTPSGQEPVVSSVETLI